jgi:phage-related holin
MEALMEGWFPKTVIAMSLTIVTMLQSMFSAKAELVILLFLAIMIDLITGMMAAKRRKDPLTSLGLRQTVVKCIEYFALLIMCVGLSNVYGEEFPFVEHLVTWGFFYATVTEIKSIIENLSNGSSRARQVWQALVKIVKDKYGQDI